MWLDVLMLGSVNAFNFKRTAIDVVALWRMQLVGGSVS